MTDGSSSARLNLPYLHPGQAQKEMSHNEAIAAIDLLLHPVVVQTAVQEPPIDPPQEGACVIVGDAPSGIFSGHEHAIACWTEGGWRFAEPFDGLSCWHRDVGMTLTFRDGAGWTDAIATKGVVVDGLQVVGTRRPAISDPVAGVSIDAEARAAIGQILSSLRAHGLIAPA